MIGAEGEGRGREGMDKLGGLDSETEREVVEVAYDTQLLLSRFSSSFVRYELNVPPKSSKSSDSRATALLYLHSPPSLHSRIPATQRASYGSNHLPNKQLPSTPLLINSLTLIKPTT